MIALVPDEKLDRLGISEIMLAFYPGPLLPPSAEGSTWYPWLIDVRSLVI